MIVKTFRVSRIDPETGDVTGSGDVPLLSSVLTMVKTLGRGETLMITRTS